MPQRSSLRWIVTVALLAVGLSALMLDLAYLLVGSQELFPTAERFEAARLAAGIGALVLGVIVWLIVRQLRRLSRAAEM